MAVDAKTGYLNYLSKVASSEMDFACWVFKGEKLLTFPEVVSLHTVSFFVKDLVYLGRND